MVKFYNTFVFRNLILFLIIGILIFWGGVYMHEKTHQTIYGYHGINSTISILNFDDSEYFWDALTILVDANQTECNEVCQLSQNMVEAIGYQDMYIWMIIFAGFLMVISILSLYCDIKLNLEVRDEQEKTREEGKKQEGQGMEGSNKSAR